MGAVTTSSSPPPPVSTKIVSGFRWDGAVPWQKWTQFYNKVVSRFSNKGLKLRVVVEVAPQGGISEQDVHETRNALKEMGLSESVAIVADGGADEK